MMYNPYNWEIIRSDKCNIDSVIKEEIKVKNTKECLLEELARLSIEKERISIKNQKLFDEVSEINEEIISNEKELCVINDRMSELLESFKKSLLY